jgi:lamin-B receptor
MKRVGRPRNAREASPPLASRTRSKSPARVEGSGRDSAPLIKRVGRAKKNETPSEEISSSSQSSTPKKLKGGKKDKPISILDDSGDNEEVANINSRGSRLATLRKRLTPANYKNTPSPSKDKRSVSRTASSLTKEDSDEDDDDDVKVVPSEQTDFQNLGIFTKPLVNFILLILLGLVPIILLICSQANWKWPAIVAYIKRGENFCNVQSLSFILAIHSGVALLSLLPVGRFIRLPDSETEYKYNGILSAVIITSFLFALELKNLDAFSAIYNNLDRLLCLSIGRSLLGSIEVLSLARYRPSSEPNAYGKSGKLIVDFVAGRELNPKLLGRFDIKRIHYNESIILLLIINITLLFKNVTIPTIEAASEGSPINELIKQTYNNFLFIVRNSEYNAAALVVSGLLALYALDLLIYEHHLSTSFQINHEGTGAEVLLRFGAFPFLLSLLPRFLYSRDVQINSYILAIAATVFIIGLIIKRGSNCLKYEYRIHPSDAKFKG